MDQATLNAIDSGSGGVALRLRAFELAAQIAPLATSQQTAARLVGEAKIIEAYLTGAGQSVGADAKPSDA